jgi:surface protein
MKSMFCGCNTLEELDVSSFDTSKVTNMSYMFDGMGLLERLYASRYFQTTSVSESANMFRNDPKLV